MGGKIGWVRWVGRLGGWRGVERLGGWGWMGEMVGKVGVRMGGRVGGMKLDGVDGMGLDWMG